MNPADIVGIGMIVIFSALGAVLGTLRAAFAFGGMFLAFQVTDRMVENQATMNSYIFTFIGIFLGLTVAGILLYGATKIHPIESLEGVFGFILGFCTGWGIARFIFSVYWFYLPEAAFTAHIVAGGMVAWDIFDVTPYQTLMNRTTSLRNPDI